MEPRPKCPRCGKELVLAPSEAGPSGGEPSGTSPPSPSAGSVCCDECGAEMGGDAGPESEGAGGPRGLGGLLLYGLSLPERAVRSAIGLGAGAVQEVAGLLVPKSFQDAQTYRVVVRNSLNFLTTNIAGVKSQDAGDELPPDFVARKTVGNFLDLAGLATFHVSPLWMLAIVSDVAHGTKTYVSELADELQSKGLIDDTSVVHGVDDLLAAVGKASGRTAAVFDAPPLSTDQLRATLHDVRAALGSADLQAVLPAGEVQRLWNEMREIATRENVSLLGVSAGVTMRSLERLKAISSGALSGVHVAGDLLSRHVVSHYVDALTEIRTRGFFQTLRESYSPYVEAVWTNFSGSRGTITEDVVSGRAIGRAMGKVSRWFRGPDEDGAASPGQEPRKE